MSYYEDQEEAWFANDCKGSPGDYEPYDPDSWPNKHYFSPVAQAHSRLTKSQKRNRQRKRAKAAKAKAAG